MEIVARLPVKMVYCGTALGAIALIRGMNLPPELAYISGTVGVNIVSNMLERVARGEKVSDEELVSEFREAVSKSHIDEQVTRQEFRHALRELFERHDELLIESVRVEFLDGIETLATRNQAELVIQNQERLLALLQEIQSRSRESELASSFTPKSRKMRATVGNTVKEVMSNHQRKDLGVFHLSRMLDCFIVSIKHIISNDQKAELEVLGWECSHRGAVIVWELSDDARESDQLSEVIADTLMRTHYEALLRTDDIV